MYYENILKAVSALEEKSVIIFELDHKLVGVICEGDTITDYILDKPQEYAKECGYQILQADNTAGAKLVPLNLDKEQKNAWIGSFLLLCTVLLTTTILYFGYKYLEEIPLMRSEKEQTLKESEQLLKAQTESTAKTLQNIDILNELNLVEDLTRKSGARLHQMRTENNKIFVEIKNADIGKLRTNLPPKSVVTKESVQEGTMGFYYEKI